MWQINFVQACTQAPVEHDMYMELKQGKEMKHGNSKDCVLKLLAKLYGQKQAKWVWNHYLVEKPKEIGFLQSLIDECMSYCDDIIFIIYVDDDRFFGNSDDMLMQII